MKLAGTGWLRPAERASPGQTLGIYGRGEKVLLGLACALHALVSAGDYPQFHFFGLTSAWLLSDDVREDAP